MHTVVETASYLRAAEQAGITESERADIVTLLANDPDVGDLIRGSGGCRKVRVAGRGKGKSGGYRVVTYYADQTVPVYLLTVFGKSERSNLSDAEVNMLAVLTKELLASHRRAHKVVPIRT
jgi:hypothetical protein